MGEWRVRLLDPASAEDRRALDELLAAGAAARDTLDAQIDDLIDARAAGRPLDPAERARRRDALTGGAPIERYGRWVHYPWHREVVRVLPPEPFHELRTDRNRHRITAAEQRRLRGKRVAVAGLSVGLASALTLAAEGVGGAFHLADFDALGLSNLNRIQAGVRDLGVNKAVIAARRLLELDPYLELAVFEEGVSEQNLAAFLSDGVDLLVEECDDLAMKLRLRERARALGIPVVMETSDRGMLDVERFDLEPERPVLHGALAGLRADDLRGLGAAEKLVHLARLVDVDRVSAALAASVVEVGQSTASWPQLASAVSLGGAVVTEAARRVLLGEPQASGRHYVDLAALVGREPSPPPAAPETGPVPAPPADAPPPAPRADPLPAEAELRWLVGQATLAPSGGNAQPWRFALEPGAVVLTADPARCRDRLSSRGLAPAIALGAAAENLALAATRCALSADVHAALGAPTDAGAPTGAVRIGLRRRAGQADPDPLAFAIAGRACHRRATVPSAPPLTDAERAALTASAATHEVRVELHEDPGTRAALGRAAGAWDRWRILSPALHPELVAELRMRPAEAAATRDGIDVRGLELSPRLALGLRVCARADTAARLRAIDGGAGLGEGAAQSYGAAVAVARFLVRARTPAAYFVLGRALQRFWLTAASLGVGAHPYGAYLLLLDDASLEDDDAGAIAAIGRSCADALPTREGWTDAFLLLLNRAPPPTAPSLRRPVDAVLS